MREKKSYKSFCKEEVGILCDFWIVYPIDKALKNRVYNMFLNVNNEIVVGNIVHDLTVNDKPLEKVLEEHEA